MESALEKVTQRLEELKEEKSDQSFSYAVPSLWLAGEANSCEALPVNPFDYFLQQIEALESLAESHQWGGKDWTSKAVVYNAFVRATTAFDHDEDGQLSGLNSQGWRERGTFLKTLSLLPYIKTLGANTLYLLPITSIGLDGRKGDLGSPYAIRNHLKLDENLSEPILDLPINLQFAALVEGAHKVGMKVVLEFVLRTTARDADWIGESPHWYYWIDGRVEDRKRGEKDPEKFGPPIFPSEILEMIKEKVEEEEDFSFLPPPSESYQNLFFPPPEAANVYKEGDSYRGRTEEGQILRIPGAFADWPPDDVQPPWDDVTYLRLFDHSHFEYMAYNTLRMYDEELNQPEFANEDLWSQLSQVVPHYEGEFDIDGVMIDMGHALPGELKSKIIKRARKEKEEFAFWDENFKIEEETRKEGYNAVLGSCWYFEHQRQEIWDFLSDLSKEDRSLPFMATAETHNTPRAAGRKGGKKFSLMSWALNCLLPGVPFIHSGFELLEICPVNTGLGFEEEEIEKYPPEKLPLFSTASYSWIKGDHICSQISELLAFRSRHSSLVQKAESDSLQVLSKEEDYMLAFLRKDKGEKGLFFAANYDFEKPRQCRFFLSFEEIEERHFSSETGLRVGNDYIEVELEAGEYLVLALEGVKVTEGKIKREPS